MFTYYQSRSPKCSRDTENHWNLYIPFLLGPRQRMLAELYCFRLVRLSVRGHSNSVIFYRISSKFHIWIASTNLSFKFENGFCPTSDNQDGRQNGRHLSIAAVVVTLTQSILIGFLPNFIMDCFYQTLH